MFVVGTRDVQRSCCILVTDLRRSGLYARAPLPDVVVRNIACWFCIGPSFSGSSILPENNKPKP